MLLSREVLFDALDHDGHLKNLIRVWPLRRLHLKECLDEHPHIHRVVRRDGWVLALQNSLEEAVHVVCSERRH